jgi:hypothetical protein
MVKIEIHEDEQRNPTGPDDSLRHNTTAENRLKNSLRDPETRAAFGG